MFNKDKLFGHLFSCLVILFSVVILTSGCETAEPEPEVDQEVSEESEEVADEEEEEPEKKEEVADEIEEEELNDNLVFMLPVNARNLTASPLGDYLLFTNGGTQFEPYFLIDTRTYEAEYCDQQRSYWGEVEQLPTPGVEHGRAYSPQFSPDGEKLLYVGYGYEDHDEYGAGSIYLSRLDLPPEVYDQVKLEDKELTRGIRPVWKADLEGIYYVTPVGIMSYCSSEERVNKLFPTGDLNGLAQDGRIAPHAFHVEDDLTWLAYFYEGRIKLASLENGGSKLEVFDTGLSDINQVEFIFNSSYLVLESAYTFDVEGHWLEFLDMQTGELVALDNEYLPLMQDKTGYLKTEQGELIINNVKEQENSAPVLTTVLIDENLRKVRSLDLPPDVIRIGDTWCVTERSQEGTALYKLDIE